MLLNSFAQKLSSHTTFLSGRDHLVPCAVAPRASVFDQPPATYVRINSRTLPLLRRRPLGDYLKSARLRASSWIDVRGTQKTNRRRWIPEQTEPLRNGATPRERIASIVAAGWLELRSSLSRIPNSHSGSKVRTKPPTFPRGMEWNGPILPPAGAGRPAMEPYISIY